MTPEQRTWLQDFAATRIRRTDHPGPSPVDLYSFYRQCAQQEEQEPAPRPEFTIEILALGFAYVQIGRDYHWYLRILTPQELIQEAQGGGDAAVIQDPAELRRVEVKSQLEALRQTTYLAAQDLRAQGKHHMANQTVKTYLLVLEAYRSEVPPPPAANEAADYSAPPIDPLPEETPSPQPN